MRTIDEWADRLENITDDVKNDKSLSWGMFAIQITIAFILLDILREIRLGKNKSPKAL